jgi:hypothetical protein
MKKLIFIILFFAALSFSAFVPNEESTSTTLKISTQSVEIDKAIAKQISVLNKKYSKSLLNPCPDGVGCCGSPADIARLEELKQILKPFADLYCTKVTAFVPCEDADGNIVDRILSVYPKRPCKYLGGGVEPDHLPGDEDGEF